VAWIGGGTASRQATSAYVLHAANTEFSQRTVLKGIELFLPLSAAAAEAQAALDAIRHRRAGTITARLLGKGAACP
jgi:hypothetical protein